MTISCFRTVLMFSQSYIINFWIYFKCFLKTCFFPFFPLVCFLLFVAVAVFLRTSFCFYRLYTGGRGGTSPLLLFCNNLKLMTKILSKVTLGVQGAREASYSPEYYMHSCCKLIRTFLLFCHYHCLPIKKYDLQLIY